MNVLVRVGFFTLFLCLKECTADCDDFRQKCTSFCLQRDGGVNTNECWGSPAYRYCTCSDNYIHFVPGYTCENSGCPTDVVEEGTTKKPIQRKTKPLLRRRIPQRASNLNTKPKIEPIITDDCKDFRSQCSAICNGDIENDQCWGVPRYRQCKCTTNVIHLIGEYDCEHSDCIDCTHDFGFGSCKQPEPKPLY